MLAGATAVLILSVSGCGAEDKEAPSSDFLDESPTALVSGRLLQVDSTGSNPKPVAGTVILSGKDGAKVTTEVERDGTFEVRVYPGTFQVTGTSPQPDGGAAQCAAQDSATTVSAEAPTSVDVLCFVQ